MVVVVSYLSKRSDPKVLSQDKLTYLYWSLLHGYVERNRLLEGRLWYFCLPDVTTAQTRDESRSNRVQAS